MKIIFKGVNVQKVVVSSLSLYCYAVLCDDLCYATAVSNYTHGHLSTRHLFTSWQTVFTAVSELHDLLFERSSHIAHCQILQL